jgi:mercuric ion binding protein
MNTFKFVFSFFIACILFTGCKEKEAVDSTQIPLSGNGTKIKNKIEAANLQTASFTIKGMTCAVGCAKTIQEELNGLDGVKTAKVNFEKESATVSFDKMVLDFKKITRVVEATADGKSYKVSNINL